MSVFRPLEKSKGDFYAFVFIGFILFQATISLLA
jgi:hypothetical protein